MTRLLPRLLDLLLSIIAFLCGVFLEALRIDPYQPRARCVVAVT